MNDAEILQRIHDLVDAEHRLRAEVGTGQVDRADEAAELRRLEETSSRRATLAARVRSGWPAARPGAPQ